MNLVDILIIIFLITGAAVGFKRGFTKSLVNFIGIILVIILAYLFKNPVSELLMKIFPFLPFGGYIKGITVLNIALYEFIAFFLLFSILEIILKVLSLTTGIFEKILNFTIILGIPSKILGTVLGLVKNYVIVFFVLYFLSMPNFSEVSVVNDSNLREPILKYTPLLSNVAKDSLNILDEFKNLSNKYKDSNSTNEFNLETLDLFLKYKVTTVKNVKELQKSGKIDIKGIDKVLSKYEED